MKNWYKWDRQRGRERDRQFGKFKHIKILIDIKKLSLAYLYVITVWYGLRHPCLWQRHTKHFHDTMILCLTIGGGDRKCI